MTLPDPAIIAVLIKSAASCTFCDSKAEKCLRDQAGHLFPVCEPCHGMSWPLMDAPASATAAPREMKAVVLSLASHIKAMAVFVPTEGAKQSSIGLANAAIALVMADAE